MRDDVLVSFANDVEGHTTTGLRVLQDGSVEHLGDQEPWRPAWRYDTDSLQAVREAVAAAHAAGLDARYAPVGGESHPTTTTWRLCPAGAGERTVEVVGDGTAPPQLQRLYRRIFELRPQVEASSVWRVRVDDDLVERRVEGEPAGVTAIAPLVHALFVRPDAAGNALPGDPAAPLLVEVVWSADEAVTETTRVYADGRAVSVKGGVEAERRRYGAGEVRAIEAAIAQVGWVSLPDLLRPS